MKIGIIVGSIREGRRGGTIGDWVAGAAAARTDATWELIDLKAFDVPLMTSAVHPMMARKKYDSPQIQRWSEAIDSCDGFVFVTAEYNHSVPGAFKNAVDVLGSEWMGKPVGFVSYGSAGGHRAVEHWRGVLANFSMDAQRAQVALYQGIDYDAEFTPLERRARELTALFDAVVKAVN